MDIYFSSLKYIKDEQQPSNCQSQGQFRNHELFFYNSNQSLLKNIVPLLVMEHGTFIGNSIVSFTWTIILYLHLRVNRKID